MLRSPIPYTGSKFKLLPQLLPLFPKNIDTFYDVFCGGFNVGLNVDSNQVIAVDSCPQLIEIFQYWQSHNTDELLNLISLYQLSKTNKDGYIALRQDYNNNPSPVQLFALICHSFNFQLRFNDKNKFNMPFGANRSCFNDNIKFNLNNMLNKIKQKPIEFHCGDFSNFFPKNKNDFFYVDPPYRLGTATYNRSWGLSDDLRLFDHLDKIHEAGFAFGISNVVVHKGTSNQELIDWAKKYHCHELECHYSSCSYHKIDRNSQTIEVFVSN